MDGDAAPGAFTLCPTCRAGDIADLRTEIARFATDDAREIAELRRINALYRDALSVIAGHPNYGASDTARWLIGKAAEALGKTEAAREGRIYAQIGKDNDGH